MYQEFAIFVLLIASASADIENPCEGRHLEFVNDYAGCSRYFSCVNGVAHPVECMDGWWFFEDFCHPPDSVACQRCPNEGVVSIPVVDSCTEYTLCINGVPLDRECAPGTRFDPEARRCNLMELVECIYVNCPDDGVHIVADPSSCRHYIICDDGEEVARRECAEGLLFDPEEGVCSRDENIFCPIPTAPNI